MTAMTYKRANSSVEYWNVHMLSSVVLLDLCSVILILQQEYIFYPQEIKKTRGFGVNRSPLCFASDSPRAHIPLPKQW